MKKNSIYYHRLYHKLLKEFHPTLNGKLKLSSFTSGISKEFWWQCSKSSDHQWKASLNSRTSNNTGCPYCSGKSVIASNCLAATHVEVANQWHPAKNINITPFDVVAGSHKKIWWKCPVANDHEWQASVYAMTKAKIGCPYCNGRKVALSNCLATTHPHIAKQWHPNKNKNLTPLNVSHGQPTKIWWQCTVDRDHIWITSLCNRSNGSNCPYCSGHKASLLNCLATVNPKLSEQWHPTKNLLTPFDVTPASSKKVWWQCKMSKDHEWIASIHKRASGIGCPCCAGYKIVFSNCLAIKYPELTKEWHPTKNLPLTPFDVGCGTGKMIWWKCSAYEDHEWQATLNSRTSRKTKCPCCYGDKIVLSNCLATTHKGIAEQWHPTKNLNLTPFDVSAGSEKKVWWKCPIADDHEWQAVIYSRVAGIGCPCCSGYKVVRSNCLAIVNPEIAKQWHPTKNLPLTPFHITKSNGKKVWWKCNQSPKHEWQAIIASRTKGCGCPYCFESTGERKIKDILMGLNIEYESEKKFEKCKYKHRLEFDFYLPEYNALIEYDGGQHFKAIKHFGGENTFKLTKKRDKIKNKFAKKYNIPLLRIPYTKFDRIQDEIMNFLGIKRQKELF